MKAQNAYDEGLIKKPANSKPVKDGKRLIGFVATKPTGPLGYYWASEILPDGTTRHMGGSPDQGGAIRMLRERDARKTLPKKSWHVRTRNGSTVIVDASTEGEAWEKARYLLDRWAKKAFEPTNARVADRDFDDFQAIEPTISFGRLILPQKT